MSSIALIQLIKLPWILKFFWAPLIDRNASTHFHYKKWIIGSEMFYAACIIAIAFFNLQTNFSTIIVLMVLAIFFSATQDIASDALAIRILKKSERPFGNSIQSMGNFSGTLIGSGVLLMLYTLTGWSWLMVMLATFVLIALIPLAITVRKSKEEVIPLGPETRIKLRDFITFFKIPGMGRWILVLAIFYSGFLGILVVLKPWMVDLGYSVKNIGFMVGIYGTGCGAIGAFLAGFIVKYLGPRKSILVFSAYNIVATFFFLTIFNTGVTQGLLYAAIAILWSAYSMSSVLVYTVAMGKTRLRKEGTDYSIQIVITHLKGIIIALIVGRIVDKFGIGTLFIVESVVAVVVFMVILFSPRITNDIKDTNEITASNEYKN
jgi:predicted MFS family arabinose efflux permease